MKSPNVHFVREELPPGWQVMPGGKGVYSPAVGNPPRRVQIGNPSKLRQQQQDHKRFENVSIDMLFVPKKLKPSVRKYQTVVEKTSEIKEMDQVQFGVAQLSLQSSPPDHKALLTETARHLFQARQ